MAQTVQRAIDILEFCSVKPRTLREISDMCGVHRTTALRLLQTLEPCGFVRKNQHGRYGVGFRLAALAESALRQFDLRTVVHDHIEELSEKVGHTIQFAVVQDDHIVYVDKIEPADSIHLDTRIGGHVVVHTAGVAKAILANSSDEIRARILDRSGFQHYTDNTLTSRTAYDARLAETRRTGWAYDDGEYEDISNCIAAPVYDYAGDVAGAISITALKPQHDIAALEALLPDLLATTDSVSHALGYMPSTGRTATRGTDHNVVSPVT
ncbi:IclR family transcriptional regulator [Antrihabitans cavernicola]|uniref:IclR family transcriptional regulator n=1 Tax=Antrihabitans cavernicola TaxID=2495913 RepID=A0A5A7SAR0_9NOCA|nr:IclR family transcriptional regulator [Spelaeibacter cavernicola]KAA0021653.1 IclR family transcriptional regulator [Spelaeibacter cavernicola]